MEFITQNGQKKVEIKTASFKDAANLKKAVVKSLKDVGVDINNIGDIESSQLMDKLIQLLINVDTSDEFEIAVFKCLDTCIYDGFHQITPQKFDDIPEMREDYYEIVAACVEVNLRPFFKSLVSALKQKFKKIEQGSTREQK